ncbi:MAG: NAD(P)/FAD-dependent oxidoreductase [Rhodoferax sp.]
MRNLVLVGAGRFHVDLLASLAARPLPGLQTTLIAPCPMHLRAGMVAGFVAGQHALDDGLIALEPLLKKACGRWLNGSPAALDVKGGSLRLTDGSTFGFDWLSIDTGAVQDRQQIEALIPGARVHGLFLHPLEAFGALWPRVAAMGSTRPLRVAVLGATAAGAELAMAIRQRLPGSSLTLVSPGAEIAPNYPAAAQARLAKAMKRRNITVLSDLAVGIEADQILLGSGARLACDVPVIANGAQAPGWLTVSGLTLDQQGFVAVDALQRSVSHPRVFAVAANATRSRTALAESLRGVLAGSPARPRGGAVDRLNFLNYGNRRALVCWGDLSAEGRWVWVLMNWLERRHIQRYRWN